MRIYTRGGDKGKTGIHGGERVDKDDIRIEANGTLDELNAEIGIVRTLLSVDIESERPGSCRDHGVRESFIGSVLYDGTL